MFQNLTYISITCINKSLQILKGIVHIDFLNDLFFLIETTIGPTFSSAVKNNGHFYGHFWEWSLSDGHFFNFNIGKKKKGEENGATNKQP